MKLLAKTVELKALKTLTCNNKKLRSHMLASLGEDHFHYPPAKEAFRRIYSVLKSQSKILSWQEIINDPVITEDNRKTLRKFKKKPFATRKAAKNSAETLDSYRRTRHLYNMADNIINELQKDKVDVDNLTDRATADLTKAKTKSGSEVSFVSFGKNSNADKIVRNILTGKLTKKYIPTGLKTFDKVNLGFLIGGLIILAARTGTGKTLTGLQISSNMALAGAKVCYVGLEMDEEEMTHRRIANVAQVPMSDLADAKDRMSVQKRKKAYKAYKNYCKRIEKAGGKEVFFSPPEDMSVEEILFLLRPYDYDAIFIDYIGLLKGVGGDNQWQKLGDAARFGKIFARTNKTALIMIAQLTDDGRTKQSRLIEDHANMMWRWGIDVESADEVTNIMNISQKKARNQKAFKFNLYVDWETMTVRDLKDNEMSLVKDDEERKEKKKNNKKSGFNQASKATSDDFLAA